MPALDPGVGLDIVAVIAPLVLAPEPGIAAALCPADDEGHHAQSASAETGMSDAAEDQTR